VFSVAYVFSVSNIFTGGILMLIDKIRKYYDKAYDLNCAETMIYAANEEYDMNLSKETFKTMAAFGGGMAIESVCGAITGSLAVLSLLFIKDRGHESPKVKELTKEFFFEYHNMLGTDNCSDLKAKYKNDDIRCWKMVEAAAEVLDKIVLREKEYGGL
jgi:C_GCAxxG_C_C family probable redox protein